MKLFFNIILFLLFSVFYIDNAYSLSDHRIKEICQKKKKKSTCIKNLKLKKLNLRQGKQIEIPVIPFIK